MQNKKIILVVVGILFLVSVGLFFYLKKDNLPISTQELAIGIQNSPSNALVIIADKKGFFDSTKVKVNVKEFSAGKLALQALLGQSNDLDVAVSAETPVVLSTLGGNKLKVISQIVDAKNECRVVVRKDGNLEDRKSVV